jgi:hypothetical protein
MPRNTKQVLYEALTTIPIDQSITAGLGTVTSVSMTVPSILSVSGSPITTSGSLGLGLTTQSANRVFAGPTTGSAASPTFRALVAADIPSLAGTYQPLNSDLTTIAGLTATTDNFIVSVASAWASRTPAQVRTTLGLVIGTNVQAYDADLTTWAGLTPSANAQSLVTAADYSAMRTLLGLVIGTNVQAYDADLTTWAGITPGTNVGTALAVNVGTAGAFVVNGGALGTPSSGVLTNCTFPTLNQNTTGSAAKWTTARNLAGNSVDGSANVTFANKFIVQGTADTGLSAAQFLGALGTGIVKNTTTTGVLSIAVAADFPTLNQNTTGSAATLTTARAIYGNNFDGSAALTQIIASTYGGTGNGFTKFSGPATAEKTFTLPNASATILTSNAAVTIAQGGTNATSFGTSGGLAYYNGTSLVNISGLTTDANGLVTIRQGSGGADATVNGLNLWSTNTTYDTRLRVMSNYNTGYISQNAYFNGASWVADNTGGATAAIQLGATNLDGQIRFYTSSTNNAGEGTERMRITKVGNIKIGGTADRGTTEGTNQLVIFNGTAPVGTLTNGASFYAASGEMRVMDSAGNSTLLSPHDTVTNEWIYWSKNTRTGQVLRIDMERLMRRLDQAFGGGYITESYEFNVV